MSAAVPPSEQVTEQLRRRREAADRLPPLPDGRRDPLDAAASDTAARTREAVADHDAADRQGLRRVVLGRTSSGRCHVCSRTFETLAGAVSHGRAARHLVEGDYAAQYLYVPDHERGAER